jgi:hypothetical protein
MLTMRAGNSRTDRWLIGRGADRSQRRQRRRSVLSPTAATARRSGADDLCSRSGAFRVRRVRDIGRSGASSIDTSALAAVTARLLAAPFREACPVNVGLERQAVLAMGKS